MATYSDTPVGLGLRLLSKIERSKPLSIAKLSPSNDLHTRAQQNKCLKRALALTAHMHLHFYACDKSANRRQVDQIFYKPSSQLNIQSSDCQDKPTPPKHQFTHRNSPPVHPTCQPFRERICCILLQTRHLPLSALELILDTFRDECTDI